ncbi:hypothetical protein ACPA54_24470 [Uniformispora flossi]|uniref:hypothetical protein n=1 Tax=Uniformispora flossi TaxID=3390723 RepID=UPI003C2EF38F
MEALGHRYRLIQIIGQGGMSHMWRSRYDTTLDRCLLAYMAPEQELNSGVDYRSAPYALGCTLYGARGRSTGPRVSRP